MEKKEIEERLKFGKVISHVYDKMNEETYDDIDNFLANMKVGFEEEFRRFLVQLLKQFSGQFKWSFASPQSELFGKSWKEFLDRYQVMDDTGREDLYMRLKTYFRQYFLDMFPYAGEETAVAIAKNFSDMFIEKLRNEQIQAKRV